MSRKRVGVVTAWAECGMGYLAKNWIHTLDKHSDKITYQIFSRSAPWAKRFRWSGPNVVDGPNSMDINCPEFWAWIEEFKPEVILFQDQNICSESDMKEESDRLKKLGIKLINYADWIMNGDIPKYKGLYDINLSHIERNHNWFVDADLESPTLIHWGVMTENFPFIQRDPKDKVTFYINLGTGTPRKGYTSLPATLERMKGPFPKRLFSPEIQEFNFLATAVENSKKIVQKRVQKYFAKHPNCELRFKTADNTQGGHFGLGDVYIYPTRKEGVGLTITEAMCTGLPIVTTDYPTMNEWVDDGVDGTLIRVKKVIKDDMPMDQAIVDENHLAEIMLNYINNPEIIAEQSRAARQKIEEKYNWDHRDAEFLKLLDIEL